ncbi:hypothetical protein F7725_008454 [Dissostichus mawsoni]|uniref:Uncharacterized protein n=1 Tax=Dissostichus mawsoni TaxID=36200 RepID=A0A7J5Y8J0_DISMA|nr:hypothetical protein F7725_008454 [Dissostichus mawsoni]
MSSSLLFLLRMQHRLEGKMPTRSRITGPPALIPGHQRVLGQHLHQVAPPQAELVLCRCFIVEHGPPESRCLVRYRVRYRVWHRVRHRAASILRPAEHILFR